MVPGRGVPADPAGYDYRRAAVDALHFSKLVGPVGAELAPRRRLPGAALRRRRTPRRLAPHLHTALRGAIPRTTIRAVTRGTYHQLWWPLFDDDDVVYPDRVPVWDRDTAAYRDPDTGRPLTTWAQALDALDADPAARPAHVMRFGTQVDIKGIDGGSPDADRAVRYLTKYLTKSVADTYADPDGEVVDVAYEAHIDRLHAQLRYLPCSPECANWLRYGIQPKNPPPASYPVGAPPIGRCPIAGRTRSRRPAEYGSYVDVESMTRAQRSPSPSRYVAKVCPGSVPVTEA
jgi:hypothetical protein